MTYDGDHRVLSIVDQNGGKTAYEYDAAGRMIATTDALGGRTAYEYDAADNLTRIVNALGSTTEYAYDAVGQITSFTTDGRSEKYSYDAVGNMLEKYVDDQKITMTYNAANEMTSMSGAGGTIKYTYDASGNLTGKQLGGKKDAYTYDVRGNLASYTGYDGFRQKYNYDALGNLYEKAVSGNADRTLLEEAVTGKQLSAGNSSTDWETTNYIYDIARAIPEVLTESFESGTVKYEYGIERIAAYSSDGKDTVKTQYVYDAGGTVVQTLAQTLTADLKASTAAPEVASYAYNPFGEMLGDAVSGYGYNGEYFDASVGMLNLRARMYEPLTMRFSQRDLVPGDIGESITLNRYLYCQNNPLSFCDPLGTSVFKKLVSAAKSAAKGAKSAAKAVAAKDVSTAAKAVASTALKVRTISTAVAKVSTAVSNVAKKVAANSNCKLIKSVANKVAAGADAVTKVANKVTEVSTKVAVASLQVAKTYDKIAADAWQDAKTNFAAAGKDLKSAYQEAKEKTKCFVDKASTQTANEWKYYTEAADSFLTENKDKISKEIVITSATVNIVGGAVGAGAGLSIFVSTVDLGFRIYIDSKTYSGEDFWKAVGIDTAAVVLDYAAVALLSSAGASWGGALGAALTAETGPGVIVGTAAGVVMGGAVGAAAGVAVGLFAIDPLADKLKDQWLTTDEEKI